MHSIQERNFHLLMAGLFASALFVEPVMATLLESWAPPQLGIFPLAIAFLWLARYATWKSQQHEIETKRIRHELAQLEERLIARINALPQELAKIRRIREP